MLLVADIVLCLVVIFLTIVMHLIIRELRWAIDQLKWENERFVFIAEVYQAVTAVKHHKFTRGRQYEGRFGPNGPGGYRAMVWEHEGGSTELNYETLADMVMLEHEQQELLVVAIDHLKLYELENPRPERPTYFGHHLPIGVIINAKH